MNRHLGIILLISAVAAAMPDGSTMPLMTKTTQTAAAATTPTTAKPDQTRDKRQLGTGGVGIGIPIYLDNLEPVQPVVQPVAVAVAPQQPGFLPNFAQNIPIVGTLLTNLPLQNLLNGLGSTVGGLNLGQLGALANLGQLGNLVNLGGAKPPTPGIASAPAQTCPITQKLTCRCESLLPLPLRSDPESALFQIVEQKIKVNEDESRSLRLVISNGIVIHHRNSKDATKQIGYYSLPFQKDKYLNLHYSINPSNYTVKADMSSSPPNTDFDTWTVSN